VTFTLPGFTTVIRDGLALSGANTYVVDVALTVGGIEESVTVTGEAPIVDVQTVTRSQVLDQALIDALPTVQRYAALGALIPGVVSNDLNNGATGDQMSSLSVHGGDNSGQRILSNGVNTSGIAGGGNISGVVPNANAAAEVVMDTSAASAELSQGGVRINYIPRDGGNTFAGSTNFSFSNASLQGSNFTQRLQDLGLGTPDTIEKSWDVSGGFGGPLLRDELWFWAAAQDFGAHNGAADSFYNLNAFNPNVWTYEPDTSRPGVNKGHWYNAQIRLTWQASQRNKLALSFDTQDFCRCPDNISATRAPEAGRDRRFPHQMLYTAEWTAPLTNRLLVELVGLHRTTRWGNMQMRWTFPDEFDDGTMAQMIAVQEQTTGLWYRNGTTYNSNFNHNYFFRGAVSYVTGSHNLKVGFTNLTGWLEDLTHQFNAVDYRVNNGVPNRITSRATPWLVDVTLPMDLGIFVQDRWTTDRLTLNLGLRYDHLETGWPEMHLGPASLIPDRDLTFPAVDTNISWSDITYRFGASYDLQGDGRTALKVSANKYLAAQTSSGLGQAPHPANTLVNTVNRSWTDADGDFFPDCNLISTVGNGECGPMSNSNFGTTTPGDLYDEDMLKGWGKRGFDWEFSAGVQRELLQGVSLDVAYFRRIFGNFQVADNVLVDASDFDAFTLVAPSNADLPGGGGQTIADLYNIKPASFGQEQILNTLASKYGKQTRHWNGVDVTLNTRLQNGLTLQGGVSTGRQTADSCAIRAALPEIDPTDPYCNTQEPFLTQVKLLAVYTIPRIDVLVSGTLQSYPGPEIAANFNANNAYLAANSTLGRSLAGGTSNVAVNLIAPDTEYGERLNQVDVRVGKIIRIAGTRATVNLDVYNLLNVDTITSQNNTFGGAWLRPTNTVLGRFAKVSATFDF
jgi:outer membrane receptor protein involved in Fe transport